MVFSFPVHSLALQLLTGPSPGVFSHMGPFKCGPETLPSDVSPDTQELLQGVVALSLVPFGQVFIGFFSIDKTKALESGTQNLTEAPASPCLVH